MKRSLALALCFCSAVSLASAQESAPASNAPSIAGAVVKEPGSEPLKKVLVQVIAEDQKQGGDYTATTDADGHFRVEKVVPGRYRIFLEKAGLVGVNERGLKSDVNVVTVQAGQSVEDLLFRMLPTAVISGRVTDEDGDPMFGVRVIALRRKPGKAAREAMGSGATNDIGEYRLAGLFPGQDSIMAMPPPDFRDYEKQQEKSPPSANPGDAQPDTRYVSTYYPGTYDAVQASVLTLKAGDEMPVNFTLVPARTYRIRGIVSGVTAGQKPVVELVSKAGDAYVVRAGAGTGTQLLSVHQDVSVVATDVEGIKLTPLPSFTLSGHLRNDGGAAVDLTQYLVNLRLAELPEDPAFFISQDFFGTNASVDRLGNFEWKDVNAGTYIVQLYGGGG